MRILLLASMLVACKATPPPPPLAPKSSVTAAVPVPVITDYANNVKGVAIGATVCMFYPQTPSPGQLKVNCWNGSSVKVCCGVFVIGTAYSFSGSFVGTGGAVSWYVYPAAYVYPSATSQQIGYIIFGFAPTSVPVTIWNGVGSVMVCCGPHETGIF